MSAANDIYNLKGRVAIELKKVKADNLNGKLLFKYYRSMVAEGLSLARIAKCLHTLRNISGLLGKPFPKANKSDVVELVARISEKDFSEWTKYDYKVILKKFYKWLYGSEDYLPEVKWIRPKSVGNKLVKEDLLSPDEINRLAEAATSIRDKALILVLFETGRRIGEILTLRVGDVEFDQYGARLKIEGKTGSGLTRVVASAPKLATWIDMHPVAQMLVGVYTEIGRIEKEARRLKLLGSLDYDVYSTLINGYVSLMGATLKLAEIYGFDGELRRLYEFYKSERYNKHRDWDGRR